MNALARAFRLQGVNAKTKLGAIHLANQGDAQIVGATIEDLTKFACCGPSSAKGIVDSLLRVGFIRKGAVYNGYVSVMYAFANDYHESLPWPVQHINYVTPPKRVKTEKDTISPELRSEVYYRDNYTCLACGETTNLSVDHVVPESLGGETILANLQTLCRKCNLSKGATYWDYRTMGGLRK